MELKPLLSTEYKKGLHTGVSRYKKHIGNYIKSQLRSLSALVASEPSGNGDYVEALLMASIIYAHIYDTEKIFFEEQEKGRLLTEPEIRFGRIANEKERLLSMEVLSEKWALEEAEDK